MADVYNPQHFQRNRMAMLSQAGVNLYAPPPAATVARPQVVKRRAGAMGGRAAGGVGGAVMGSQAGGTYAPPAVGSGAGGRGGAFAAETNAANAANIERYNDALGRSDALHGRAMGNIDQMGKAESMASDERLDQATQSIQQNLRSAGLGASTVGIAPTMAAQRERTFAGHDLADRLAKLRLGTDQDITFQRLGMMERREDVAPDMNLLAQLAQQQGQYGGGAGWAAPLMGGGFGQVGFGGMGQMGGGWGTGGGDYSPPQQTNWTKLNALLANQGKFKYQSGYSNVGAGSKGRGNPYLAPAGLSAGTGRLSAFNTPLRLDDYGT